MCVNPTFWRATLSETKCARDAAAGAFLSYFPTRNRMVHRSHYVLDIAHQHGARETGRSGISLVNRYIIHGESWRAPDFIRCAHPLPRTALTAPPDHPRQPCTREPQPRDDTCAHAAAQTLSAMWQCDAAPTWRWPDFCESFFKICGTVAKGRKSHESCGL